VIDDDRDDPDESETWSGRAGVDNEVEAAVAAFTFLVRLSPTDAGLAHLAVAAVVRSLGDASGPDAPTPGMMGVPVLIEDALARAALADASPLARETLGDLEREIVRLGPATSAHAAARIRAAIRDANRRLGGESPQSGPSESSEAT
jgi:hypothetical protein